MDIQKRGGYVAYFSLEIGIEPNIPLYSGGLGVLAGDTIKSFADQNVPVIGVSLMYKKGYFHQVIENGVQKEIPVKWNAEDYLKKLPNKVKVNIEGRDVYIGAWKYDVYGLKGNVPIIFLDTDLDENSEWDKNISAELYGGDRWYRLCQEIILGIGGVKMLRDLGYDDTNKDKMIKKFHMNEGHASLLTLELYKELMKRYPHENDEFYTNKVKEKCVFTTHTPVPAGHDVFKKEFVEKALKDYYNISKLNTMNPDEFNMTYLALNNSSHINGVAKKHKDISRKMFPGYQIDSITNGVHSVTWTCSSFRNIFDKYIPGWRKDNFMLRYALNIPKNEIWKAHEERKKELIDFVNRTTDTGMSYDTLTIGFARRAATYKRADLILRDVERLKKIAENRPLQIIMAGKAHPNDDAGKGMIKHVFDIIESLPDNIKIVYLPNYEMWLGQLMTSGVDVWLNTPLRPLEASGTSGMKAAHNGVPHFSILDGWWLEGHVENVTGWSIGARMDDPEQASDDENDAKDLYKKLEEVIIPLFYDNKDGWIKMMHHTISHNASFFNTQRMVSQYVMNCYFG
ncbi:MAG: alpha-glucan family phosphorylase [Nanobdellota archaeon]